MTVITCPVCKQRFSDSAKGCPNCIKNRLNKNKDKKDDNKNKANIFLPLVGIILAIPVFLVFRSAEITPAKIINHMLTSDSTSKEGSNSGGTNGAANPALAVAANNSGFATTPDAAGTSPSLEKREAYAKIIENSFQNQNMAGTLTLEGENKDILNMKYAQMSESYALKMVNAKSFMDYLSSIGFKKIIFSNEAGGSWSFDVK